MGIGWLTSQMVSNVLEYCQEPPINLAMQIENFYISPFREKAP